MPTRPLVPLLLAAALIPCAPAAASPGDLSVPARHCTGQTDAGGLCAANDQLLEGVADTVIAPDGRFVYAATASGIRIRSRDPGTGAFTATGYVDLPERLSAVELSPDGQRLYVAGATTTGNVRSSVRAFARDEQTGALAQVGCFADAFGVTVAGCTMTQGLRQPADIAASADGGALYVAAQTGGGYGANQPEPAGAISVLRIDPVTGGFTDLQCLPKSPTPSGACATAAHEKLGRPTSIAVAPEGGHVHAVTQSGVVTLDRIASGPDAGRLTTVSSCIGGPASNVCPSLPEFAAPPHTVALTPDGGQALVLVGSSSSAGVVVLDRDSSTGGLTYLQCISQNTTATCEPDGAMYDRTLRAVTSSPDGSTVYLAGGTGIADHKSLLLAFRRDPATGRLTRQSCALGHGPTCASGVLGHITDVESAPDGTDLVAAFVRQPGATGHLASFAVEQSALPEPTAEPTVTATATATASPTSVPTAVPTAAPESDGAAPVLRLSARFARGRLTLARTVDEAVALHLQLERRARDRWRAVGRPLDLPVAAGEGRLVLRGRALRRFGARRAGRFRVVAAATDAFGNRAPARAGFRVRELRP